MTQPDTSALIDEFRGQWAFLSNFYRAPFEWEGLVYPTAEHAFQAGKTLNKSRRLEIARLQTPREAKSRGQHVQLRPGWDEKVRFVVMASVLRAKFTSKPSAIRALLSTGDALLVEGNTWHDNFWGDCRCRRLGNGRATCLGQGRNHLGVLLMELRDDLRPTP